MMFAVAPAAGGKISAGIRTEGGRKQREAEERQQQDGKGTTQGSC
jgi:hypothetical protein